MAVHARPIHPHLPVRAFADPRAFVCEAISVPPARPAGRPPDARHILRLLSAGRLDEPRPGAEDRDPRALFARLVAADIRLRSFDIGVLEIQELRDAACREGRPGRPLRHWADALLDERQLLAGDSTAAVLAHRVLDVTGDDPVPPLLTLFARARLRRTLAWCWLCEPVPAGRSVARPPRARARARRVGE